MRRLLLCIPGLMAALLLSMASTPGAVFAHSTAKHANQSYFCQTHPNAPQCKPAAPVVQKPPKQGLPVTGAGGTATNLAGTGSVVTGVLGSPQTQSAAHVQTQSVAQLPATGGAATVQSTGGSGLTYLALGMLLIVMGLAARVGWRRVA